MTGADVAAELTREHREIDGEIEAFIAGLDSGTLRPEPMIAALAALRRHIYLEEVFLFPPIREAGMVMPIFVMMREHGQMWATIDTLGGLLAGDSDPAGPADHAALRDTCGQLLAQLQEHNAKEEPIIYPRADIDLPSHTSAELSRLIEDGRTPDGWVCEQAGR
ncbi:hemerythrin domain-containing protein [Mycobacterium sp.]|uniref:hemerythrin domain-containing protein n=1 Tax=Mycobacterium sp. TaxID=1785 RepID=UPI003A88AF96